MAPLLFTPAFRHQKLDWLFVAIVSTMVYIASFAMAAEGVLSSLSLSRNEDIANHLTVELPAVEDESTMSQADRIKQALAVLHASPDISFVKLVPEEETEKLLATWVTDPDLIKRLPLPALIDIQRSSTSHLSPSAIEDEVRTVVADAKVDDHAAWLSDLATLVRGLSDLIGFMIAVTAITLILAIALICRAVMATERETIELLHVLGAPDDSIARHFQHHAWRLALPAASAGFALAILSLAFLFICVHHNVDIAILEPKKWLRLTMAMVIVPIGAIAAAALSARISVLGCLQSLP